MIRITGLHVVRGRFALREVSFALDEGRYGLVIGPTGSGKSTLLEAIAGHCAVSGGAITIDGVDVTAFPPERRRLGIVYQRHHLFPHLSVRQNVAYGLSWGEPDRSRRDARIETLARALGFSGLLDRGTEHLSGGERQRVALARALAPRPRVLLLDEPLASLDPAARRQLRTVLRETHRREGTTIVHVTHDFEDALHLGDEVVLLAEGRVVQHGTPEQVFRHPATPFIAAFVGHGNVFAGRIQPGPSEHPRLFVSGPLRLEVVAGQPGPAHVLIRPEDIMIATGPLPSPPRNHLEARIDVIETIGPLAVLHLDVGVPLVAHVTGDTARELGLVAGQRIGAAIKATAVHVF